MNKITKLHQSSLLFGLYKNITALRLIIWYDCKHPWKLRAEGQRLNLVWNPIYRTEPKQFNHCSATSGPCSTLVHTLSSCSKDKGKERLFFFLVWNGKKCNYFALLLRFHSCVHLQHESRLIIHVKMQPLIHSMNNWKWRWYSLVACLLMCLH